MELASRELGLDNPSRQSAGRPHTQLKPDRPAARATGSSSGITAWTYSRSTRLEGLRNPHSVTRISLTTPGPEPATALRDQTRSSRTGPGRTHIWMAGIIVRSNRRHHARAAGSTAAQDEWPQVFLWYSVLDSVHCSRASVLPRLGPSPGPGGSCPRRTNSARTTSRPVTRTNRRTGDSPPTPHHVLGRVGRSLSCPLEPHPSPDAAGPTGVSGDSDTFTKARRDKAVRAGRPGMYTPPHTPRGPAGPDPAYRPLSAPHGPATGNRESIAQCQLEPEPDLGQARGARNLS